MQKVIYILHLARRLKRVPTKDEVQACISYLDPDGYLPEEWVDIVLEQDAWCICPICGERFLRDFATICDPDSFDCETLVCSEDCRHEWQEQESININFEWGTY